MKEFIRQYYNGNKASMVMDIILLAMMLMISVLFFGCVEYTEEEKQQKERFKDFDVVVIDSCEYLIKVVDPDFNRAYGLMAHKGNCRFCKERNKND